MSVVEHHLPPPTMTDPQDGLAPAQGADHPPSALDPHQLAAANTQDVAGLALNAGAWMQMGDVGAAKPQATLKRANPDVRPSSPAAPGSSPSAGSVDEKSAKGDDDSVALPIQDPSIAADQGTPATMRKAGFKELFRFATRWELFFNLIGLIAACAAGAAQPLMTIVFGNLTTAFLRFSNAADEGPEAVAAARASLHSEVNKDALFLVYIGIAMFAATYIYMATWVYSGEEITRRIREAYLAAILRQEIAYFDVLGAGEVTTRIQSDIQLIQEGISDKIPMSVMFIATFLTGFAVAYARSWKLALAMTSIIPCIIITGVVMNVFVAKFQQIELEHVAQGSTLAEEAMSTVRTAKAFGVEDRLVDLYDVSNRAATKLGVKKAVVQGVGLGIFFFVIYSGYALAFYFGAKLIVSGDIASGVVMNVIFSILIGAFSMAMMAPNMQALSYAFGAGGKIFETIDRVPPIDSSSDAGLRPERCDGEITVDSVDFAYPARRDVQILQKYSVTIPKGKVTALVGASGSGKSTIIGLVERFYDVDAGSLRLDGIDVRELNLKWLRTQIGLVSQEPTLFATTIRGNIEHGLINSAHEHASDEERLQLVLEAAKTANAHGFIEQLPNGYQTMVGERGFLLSGGQKQRIAIARAIVKNPRILLLDEATSALDTASEGIVQDALDRASEGRTTITIAHRLSTIRNADNIVVMGKGVILEQGTHDSLLQDPQGAYSGLVSAQKIRAKAQPGKDDAQGEELEEELVDEEAKDIEIADEKAALREEAKAEMPAGLDRLTSKMSIASAVLRRKEEQAGAQQGKVKPYGLFYLLYRLAMINEDVIWKLYVPGFISAACSGAVYPAFSILFGRSLQNFSQCSQPHGTRCAEPFASDLRHEANLNSLYFFIIAILATIVMAIQTHSLMLAASILMERLRRKMFRAYLRADVAYFDEDGHSSGALTNSLADNAQKINGLVGVTLGTIIQSISTLVVGSIIALAYGWKLALVVIACMPLTLSAGFIRLKLVVLKDAKIKKAHEGSAQRACEAAAAIRTVASLTREADCLAIYKRELKEPAKVTRDSAFYGNALYSLSQALSFWVIALGFWYGARLLADLEYGSGQFFTIFTAVVFGSIQAGNVFNFVPDISNAKTAANDSIRLLDQTPEIDSESDEGIVLEDCQGHVRLEGVHFRYPTRPSVKVLRGLDMDIKPGTYVALVGSSGCGKSTTIQLVERFYDPLAGRVTIDGHDVSSMNLRSMRRHIALVSQEPTLYDGTIGFNLRLGAFEDADSVTEAQLRKAAADANILTFIDSLPQGFETQVGGKGTQLSGGQKQRIAIARALIRDPKILLLDEATSALDSESEKIVQEALDKAARGRTTIAIAHRLSTISRADEIYVVREGVIAEKGDHRSLMAKGGLYAELVNLQELQKAERGV